MYVINPSEIQFFMLTAMLLVSQSELHFAQRLSHEQLSILVYVSVKRMKLFFHQNFVGLPTTNYRSQRVP